MELELCHKDVLKTIKYRDLMHFCMYISIGIFPLFFMMSTDVYAMKMMVIILSMTPRGLLNLRTTSSTMMGPGRV